MFSNDFLLKIFFYGTSYSSNGGCHLCKGVFGDKGGKTFLLLESAVCTWNWVAQTKLQKLNTIVREVFKC